MIQGGPSGSCRHCSGTGGSPVFQQVGEVARLPFAGCRPVAGDDHHTVILPGHIAALYDVGRVEEPPVRIPAAAQGSQLREMPVAGNDRTGAAVCILRQFDTPDIAAAVTHVGAVFDAIAIGIEQGDGRGHAVGQSRGEIELVIHGRRGRAIRTNRPPDQAAISRVHHVDGIADGVGARARVLADTGSAGPAAVIATGEDQHRCGRRRTQVQPGHPRSGERHRQLLKSGAQVVDCPQIAGVIGITHIEGINCPATSPLTDEDPDDIAITHLDNAIPVAVFDLRHRLAVDAIGVRSRCGTAVVGQG